MEKENKATGGIFLTTDCIGQVFSWQEVSQVHRTRNGIYQKKGRLISLLTDFGKINPAYPDFHGETEKIIYYTGSGKRGDQKPDIFNRSLLAAIESRHDVLLFCKLAVNRWKFLGFWKVTEGQYLFEKSRNRMIWKFRLEKSE